MQHPLWLLTKLRLYASWRKVWQSAKTIRGALLLIFAVGFFGLMIVPQIALSFTKQQQPMGNFISIYGPFLLLAYTMLMLVTSIGDQAVSFTPSEVDMLFPAPLSRRSLLSYKLLNNVAASVFMSLIIGVTNRAQYHFWLAGIVGVFLTFSFLQLLGILVAFIGQSVSGRAYTLGRRVVAVAIIALLASSLTVAFTQWEGDLTKLPSLVESTTVGKTLLFPFRIFCNMTTAERIFPDFLGYTTASLAMMAVVTAAIFKLDTDFSELAIRVSKMRYERKKKLLRGDAVSKTVNVGSTKIAMFPFWMGSGPLIWRQIVRSIRASKSMVAVLFVVLLAVGTPLYLQLSKHPKTMEAIPYIIWAALIYISSLVTGVMPIGFRGDVDRLEVFKGLPISSWAVAAGQLIGPTILLTSFHWFLFGGLTILAPQFWFQWLAGAVVALPFNFVLLCVSSTLFLYFPMNPANVGQDFQAGIKNMLMFILNYLVLAVALGIVAAVAGLVFFVTQNEFAAMTVTTTLLIAEGVAGLAMVRIAFDRFDVTKHLPS